MHATTATAAATQTLARRPCGKCEGTGLFIGRGGNIAGTCFACNGFRFVGANGERAARPAPEAVKVESAALIEAFARAKDAGLKRPKVTMYGFTVSLAPDNGKNAGALYVKHRDSDTYLGKVIGAGFLKSRDCTQEQADKVAELMANPGEVARKYGRETGMCCVCNRTLTDAESIAAGIGPICAEKYGM